MTSIKCFVCSMKNGLMVYWDEVEEAATYHVHLLIGDVHKRYGSNGGVYKPFQDEETFRELALVDVSREFKYFSFVDLAPIHLRKEPFFRTNDRDSGINYYVVVEAEDRAGKIIAQSEKVRGIVEDDTLKNFGAHGGVYL